MTPLVDRRPDYDELLRLAEQAAPGPWHVERGRIAWMIRERKNGPQVANAIVDADAAYIAAANPSAVTALIHRLRAAEERVAELERLICAFSDQWGQPETGLDADARFNAAAYRLFEAVECAEEDQQ